MNEFTPPFSGFRLACLKAEKFAESGAITGTEFTERASGAFR